MKRIFSEFAYGGNTRAGCWWDETIDTPNWPSLQEAIDVDVVIVGGGFTGISAALHLSETGTTVAVLEAESPGWGASGRNGGFCCRGGAKLSSAAMVKSFGVAAAQEFGEAEVASVELVADLLRRLGIDADTHSKGETQVAHRERDMDDLRRQADALDREGIPDLELIEARDLAAKGMNGPFHGALTNPVGFGLNPQKYLFGMANAAQMNGVALFQNSAAQAISQTGTGYLVTTEQGQVRARNVVIATNGYSSEDLPDWLAGRYIPSQSNVLVTRPLSDVEIASQGWSTDQMAYDTRKLLHYFRLMPDRRFLFGMRGGLLSSQASEKTARSRTRRDFEKMFPSWRHVESPNQWSGMVCLSRRRTPFVGPVAGKPGMFAGLAYHGNGVAMGSYSGKLLADLLLTGKPGGPYPAMMSEEMKKFPLGRARRLIMPPAYLYYALRDM